jgi:hypothetical protein
MKKLILGFILIGVFGCTPRPPDPLENLILKDSTGHYYIIQGRQNGGYLITPINGTAPNF